MNAWPGPEGNTSDIHPDLSRRLLSRKFVGRGVALPAVEADRSDWRHPSVGWGLILPESPDLTPAERARADDAPEPIVELLRARPGAPVFRIGTDWRPGHLRRYDSGGGIMDIALGAQDFGTGPGRIPLYLLIVGSPQAIPWHVQYDLQQTRYVGRLDLAAVGLARYVDALLSDWAGLVPDVTSTLGWSVDNGSGDITTLMTSSVGRVIHDRFREDPNAALRAGARFVTGGDATNVGLQSAIAAHRPALIVTTSHGATSPLEDVPEMRSRLGLLVDANEEPLDPAALGGDAAPSGAVIFAQACCSAGSTAPSDYEGVLDEGSIVDLVLRGVAKCGSMTSPLPRALLGAERPLRAFVGHVEPTFDWSLRHPETRQWMTASLAHAFHQQLFTGKPIGMALERVRLASGSFLNSYNLARERLVDEGDAAQQGALLATDLAARDWRSIVLLGDPTARLVADA